MCVCVRLSGWGCCFPSVRSTLHLPRALCDRPTYITTPSTSVSLYSPSSSSLFPLSHPPSIQLSSLPLLTCFVSPECHDRFSPLSPAHHPLLLSPGLPKHSAVGRANINTLAAEMGIERGPAGERASQKVCASRWRPGPCAGCRMDFGSIVVVTETGADVTLVAGRLAGALIVIVTEMQLDGTSSVAVV
uniref:Uncharacterized protein n=1 Tax=Knipowitschia caucasica TaxID=637954 RepID=A0AAV2LNG5_KNICA